MKLKKWFGQAIEIGLLGVIIYYATVVLWQIQPPTEDLKFKILHSAFPTSITIMGALAFIKILKGMAYLWPAIIIKFLQRLEQNLSVLTFLGVIIVVIGIGESPSVIYAVYSSIINEPEQFLYPTMASWIAIFLLIPFLFLALPLCLILFIFYCLVQSYSPKYNRVLASFVFLTSRLVNIIGLLLLAVASFVPALACLIWLITALATVPVSIIILVNPTLISEYLNTSQESDLFALQTLPWWTIAYALLGWVFQFLIMAFIGINVVTFLCAGIFTMIANFVFVRLKLNLNRAISNIIWYFVHNLSKLIEFLSPFLIFSDNLKIAIVEVGLSYALASDSTPRYANIRKFAVKFARNYLNSKSYTFGVAGKFKVVSDIAAKLLLLGDLKQADIIYSNLWESAKNQAESGKEVHTFINNIFSEVCYFYIETSQYELLNSVINYSASLVQKNQLSKLTYIANWMRADFAINAYSDQTDQAVDECLSWEKIFKLLIGLPDILNYSLGLDVLFFGKKPEDFFKFFLSSMKNSQNPDYDLMFITEHQKDLIRLLETLRSHFVTQSKIYRFISTQDFSFIPETTEIAATLIKKHSLDILGIKIEVDNSFVKDNIKLIPVVCLLASQEQFVNSFGYHKLQDSLDSAQKNGREIELAFFQCCQGKILMNTGSLENGLNTLLTGIKTYEGIRHSVSTDQLGLGFGSSYLEYYDWAIDGLIKSGNPSVAFEYTGRSTARAILDLVSRKTSRFGSVDESNRVTKLINEIQNLDFNIYFSQSRIYESPFIAKFSPTALKRQLERNFYRDKKQRLKQLLKNRDSLVAELEALDPVSATLVELKPLTWRTSSESEENSIPFQVLWSSHTITETETILCFHVIHKLSFAKNKPWDKIVCFALYKENGSLQLHHHVVDDPETVANVQPLCQGIASEVEKRELNLKTKSLDPISNSLIIPLLQHLPIGCKSLTIVANSDLQFFPWSILYDRDHKQLIEKFRIRTTPSLSLMYLLKQREDFRHTDSPTKFLVAGVEQYPNPREYLFWSGVEINRISQLYDSASVLKDAEVDEHFANQFKQAEVIHYSGHGNYRKSDSGRDALDKTYLCLYNKEISATQILDGALENPAAKVMILSACLTGLGDLTQSGSEILGLERALFHAGLSSLVTTLWCVDDFATALLMLKLHLVWRQHYNTLETLADSLRSAQLWLKNLSWQQLKQECPEIERDFYNCLATYQTRITRARANEDEDAAKKLENDLKYYQNALKRLQSGSSKKIFIHDYFWAAFQVKGLG